MSGAFGTGRAGKTAAGLLTAAGAVVSGTRAVWFWADQAGTARAVEHSATLADNARGGVLELQNLLNWGWLGVAVVLLAMAVPVGLAGMGRWLLFGFSALVCLPLGVAGWKLPAADGLDALALLFCGCVVSASAVALLTSPRQT
ncbi:hypothetical protein AB0C51_09735 [Streptomyces pathocidini]|uniref:hypothetical protein n=1 Tax=Streptomyces pathocidini TaxID=1650571 RepID=UPI0033C6EF90